MLQILSSPHPPLSTEKIFQEVVKNDRKTNKKLLLQIFHERVRKRQENCQNGEIGRKRKKVGEIVTSDQCGLYYKIVARKVQHLGLKHSYDLVLGGMGGRNEL